MAIGAPIRVPISSGAIIVAQATSGTGSVAFSFKVVGIEYKWWQQPFIDLEVGWYYTFLVTLVIAALLVVCGPPGCVTFLAISAILLIIVFGLVLGAVIVGAILIISCVACCSYCIKNGNKKKIPLVSKRRRSAGGQQFGFRVGPTYKDPPPQ